MIQKLSKSTVITSGVLISVLIVVAFIAYELTSPRGFYARQHSDLRAIQNEETPVYSDLEGNSFDLKSYEGKPVIINSWASWSPLSKNDFDVLERIKSDFGKEISVIAMNRMETKETANAYLDYIGRGEGIVYAVDEADMFFKTIEGYAMPETIVYDDLGSLRFHERGSLHYDELKAEIDELLTR